MSVTAKTTLIGMYVFDNSLFANIHLPEEVDKNIFINCLLLEKGECPVLYQDIDFNKNAFGIWSSKWYYSISRLALAFSEEYNPLHNFDRHEEYEDVEDRDKTGSTSGSTTGSATDTNGQSYSDSVTVDRELDSSVSDDAENTVSAYNESAYQPDSKTERDTTTDENETTRTTSSGRSDGGTTSSTSGTSSGTSSESEDRTLTHTGHLYGNIGVTKSQEMLLDELHLRSAHNIYDVVVQMFANEFLIPIY